MSSHPKSSTAGRVEALLAKAEAEVAALRTTLRLLNASATVAKVNGHASVVADALALDGARVETTKKKRGRPAKAPMTTREQQRAASVARLSTFDPDTPTTVAQLKAAGKATMGIGPLLHFGLLKRKGGGYVRTAKGTKVIEEATS